MKRWFGGMIVVCAAMLLLAGADMAQGMNPGPFNILHRAGAIYEAGTGWNYQAFNPGLAEGDWAVDFVYNSQGVSILHRYGAVWTSSDGWDYSGFLAGNDYARALEYLRDLGECWGLQLTDFETYDSGSGVFVLDRDMAVYPEAYIQIDWQTGTRFGGNIVFYDGEACEEISFEGTIIGDHFTAVAHNTEGTPGEDACEVLDIISGLVFWNDTESRWEIKGSYVGADLFCDLGTEAGFFGAFIAWQESVCQCPPPAGP
jgi:hypothetical protein